MCCEYGDNDNCRHQPWVHDMFDLSLINANMIMSEHLMC